MDESLNNCLILKKFKAHLLDNKGIAEKRLQELINALYEQQIYNMCVYYKIIFLVCDKLSELYNLNFNENELIKEAVSEVDQNWDKIKVQIKSEFDAKKLIDSVFGNKTGE